MSTELTPRDYTTKTTLWRYKAICAPFQFPWMQYLVPGFPVDLPLRASRNVEVSKGNALSQGITSR